MDLGLKDRKAILVGANGGIGRKVAHALAAEGCHVAVCGRTQAKVEVCPSAASLIINIAQGAVRKPWKIEIYDFAGRSLHVHFPHVSLWNSRWYCVE
jgi:NAD(P)-dependent dehydrogenase (short-subunit alcohol dehydrogenase family)